MPTTRHVTVTPPASDELFLLSMRAREEAEALMGGKLELNEKAMQRMAAAQPVEAVRPVLAQLAQLSRKEPAVSDVAAAARSGV